MDHSLTRRKRVQSVLFAFVVAVGSLIGVTPAFGESDLAVPSSVVDQFAAQKAEQVYIVLMADDPVITYEGGERGLPATRPGNGKLNPNSAAVKRYQQFLVGKHDTAMRGVGLGLDKKVYDYTVSFNGFAAAMTGAEASALLKDPNVLAVWEDELRHPTTDVSAAYLGMEAVWNPAEGSGYLGEDLIVGVIDTGIWPEHPSFSDQDGYAPAPGKGNKKKGSTYGPPPATWNGTCQSGEQWSQDDCNNKLIGAVYFADAFGWQRELIQGEYLSPRDFDGHGTHTSSTAAGNAAVDSGLVDASDAPLQITGMAPRARVAMYKACWNSDEGGCATGDLVAAIDQAVADGVDVINYSIGSAAQTVTGPDDIAFLFAADAGVFVATSNGNDGPDPNTTGSPSSDPWVTSVGAINHRVWLGSATLGDASEYSGASLADPAGTGPLPLVDAADHNNPLCYPEVQFEPPIEGKAVLCWRGDIARVAKSQAVYEQGGEGMILANVPDGASGVNADVHFVPSIHVEAPAGAAIAAYIDAEGASATVDIAGQLGGEGAVAGFSSRGAGASADIIKPDIAAPGVSVLAGLPSYTYYGLTPGGYAGYLSGTSMASPHVAGIGTLVKEAHPDWTPAMIKSALMTTADASATSGDDGIAPATPFDTGSGLVQPFAALDPGLVYDAGFLDYLGFLCGNSTAVGASTCDFLQTNGYPFDGSDLNQPNIAVGELAGFQTVSRTVTNVGPAGTYEVSVDAPAGVDVTVDPSSLTLDEGEPASYEVTFTTNASAAIGEWTFGSLTWSDGSHEVTSALAVRPVQLAAPDEVSGTGTEGSESYDVTFGYSGDFTAAPHGLVEATTEDGNVVDDPANDINVALGTGVGITQHLVEVPTGTAHARVSLFDAYTDGADDLDLYVFGPLPADPDDPVPYVGGSGSGTSAEQVDLAFPEAGTYLVIVHGWQTDGPDANYTLFSWSVPAAPGSTNLTVTAPTTATLGASDSISVDWTGLDAGTKYLGAVSYADGGGIFGLTLVSVATD